MSVLCCVVSVMCRYSVAVLWSIIVFIFLCTTEKIRAHLYATRIHDSCISFVVCNPVQIEILNWTFVCLIHCLIHTYRVHDEMS